MSDYLYSNTNLITGIASCIDLFGVYFKYNDSRTSYEADEKAMKADIIALKKDAGIAYQEVMLNV